jgi:CubicO group peptidase (beta-lactamase class C family)
MLFLCLLACSEATEKTEILEDEEEQQYAALIAAIEEDMETLGATAFSMAVITDGAISWSQGFGTETKNATPVTKDTRFRVASLTKPMTAVATLQQVEQGCISLDSPVDAYINNFVMDAQPTIAEGLLVKDTLQLTGGLVDYDLQTGENGDGMIEEFLSIYLDNMFFLAPPGRMHNYSNPNMVVAGLLVEKCSDGFFHPYLQRNIWDPLDMSRTTMNTDDVVDDEDYAIGITTNWPNQVGEAVAVDAESYNASHLWPAMGAWSSVEDMAKFALFLMNGDDDILSSEMLSEMKSIQIDSEEGFPEKGYGYGIHIKNGIKMGDAHYPVEMIYHSGAIYGYSTHMYLIPELDVGVIALINRDKAIPAKSVPLALNLGSLVDPYEPNIEIPTDFTEYVGTYHNDFTMGSFILTESESGLEIEIPAFDQENITYQRQLEPVRPDNFLIHYENDTHDQLSFIRDESGSIEYIRNRYYVGKKQEGNSLLPIQSVVQNTNHSIWADWEEKISIY